jgi:hypothetical protein
VQQGWDDDRQLDGDEHPGQWIGRPYHPLGVQQAMDAVHEVNPIDDEGENDEDWRRPEQVSFPIWHVVDVIALCLFYYRPVSLPIPGEYGGRGLLLVHVAVGLALPGVRRQIRANGGAYLWPGGGRSRIVLEEVHSAVVRTVGPLRRHEPGLRSIASSQKVCFAAIPAVEVELPGRGYAFRIQRRVGPRIIPAVHGAKGWIG